MLELVQIEKTMSFSRLNSKKRPEGKLPLICLLPDMEKLLSIPPKVEENEGAIYNKVMKVKDSSSSRRWL
jgi:hypothetical protein